MNQTPIIDTEVAVIGSGIAGLSAAMFSCNRDISAAVIGGPGATGFYSGYIDLMGVFPGKEPQVKSDPWQAIGDLYSKFPEHPLNLIDSPDIKSSLQEFLDFLQSQNLQYTGFKGSNLSALTPLGTGKPTYRVPETMWQGIRARQEKTSCLFLDIQGLKDFDAAGLVSAMQDSWPGIRSDCIQFPGLAEGREAYPPLLAQNLENQTRRRELARVIAANLQGEKAVGLPAILGIYRPGLIKREMEEIIGATIFEVPTMPSSVPGIRLKEKFSNYFDQKDNIQGFMQQRVFECTKQGDKDFLLQIGGTKPEKKLRAKSVILASGRYLAQGLQASRSKIREPLFDLPVTQPDNREDWHKSDLFDPEGHRANLAGIQTDSAFRPLDTHGNPIYRGLYAVGSILANADWMRFKCGGGLCISSAYRAVENMK